MFDCKNVFERIDSNHFKKYMYMLNAICYEK